LAQGVLGAWTSELQKLERDGSNPVAFFVGMSFRVAGRGLAELPDSVRTRSRAGDLPGGLFCVQTPLQKYFAGAVGQIRGTESRVSSHRGALANVINAARDAVDADAP
jgi:hypothetical protein